MTAPKYEPTPHAAINAVQRQLRGLRAGETRDRLLRTLAYLRRLYGLPDKPVTARDLDMRRRKTFVNSRHPFAVSKKRVDPDAIV